MADEVLTQGLQEWQACCDWLATGRGIILLRKGGIHERHGGLFEPAHDRFALLPTWLHQAPERLVPGVAATITPAPPVGTLPVPAWAQVERIWKATDLERIQDLGPDLIWTADEVARRFAYRDEPWLYVLALRVHRWDQPRSIPDDPAYAGCRSWIALRTGLALGGSRPVLDDVAFADRLAQIDARLNP